MPCGCFWRAMHQGTPALKWRTDKCGSNRCPSGKRSGRTWYLEPGLHFHTLPDLATIRGYILAMDAGTPDVESRKVARGVELVEDPKGMAAAIIQDVGGVSVAHTVMRGPGTAQEGEAHAMNSMI